MKVSLQTCVALGCLIQGIATAHAANSTNVQILSATIRDQKISGATVIVQKNGEQSVSLTTDSDGRASLAIGLAADPDALLIVRKEGYSDLVAKCPCADMTYAMSPYLDTLDGMRVVLNWGAHPRDLDGHLVYPGNHVFFYHKHAGDAEQDIDHTDGYGPETITIVRKHPGERYVYSVHDFTDMMQSGTIALSASDAKVFVYVGQTLIRTWYVPKNRRGNIWRVFAISEEGEIQDINEMTESTLDSASEEFVALLLDSPWAPPVAGGASAGLPAHASIPEGARKLNAQGEAAYRAGNYDVAISLFQGAVAADDNYGQAYSNLGLVFQKSGRVAEALWANRKAIALASGPNANTVRASTHFNNGRIYEDKGQWRDALREYQAAQEARSNTVYANAIARVQQHGAR
jgi:uncharacterized protein YfaP (DUF2135 family)